MEVKYLSLPVAEAMRADYLWIIRKPFGHGAESGTVSHLLITPYSKILRWGFLRDFLKGRHQPVTEGRCEVLVLSDRIKSASDRECVCDLRSFLERHSIWFDPREYKEEVFSPRAKLNRHSQN